MRSVGGCASALRRCSAGPRRSPVSARPVIAVWPVSAGYSRCLSLPTISSGCANWWGPRRSHARNPPTHRKSQQNRRKDLLDKQRSATQARVTFDDPTFRFANTEFFSVLLNQTELAIIIACSFDKAFEWAYRVADGVICVAQQVRCGTPHSKTALGFAVAPAR